MKKTHPYTLPIVLSIMYLTAIAILLSSCTATSVCKTRRTCSTVRSLHLVQHTSKIQSMPNHSIPRLRALHIEFFSPTDTKGARVRIKDERNNVTKWLPYDYAVGDIVEQSYTYLQEQGVIQEGKDECDATETTCCCSTTHAEDTRWAYQTSKPQSNEDTRTN